jgi:catechol 2,3-dioxygenase-like lactoylglutathione lyase family enzyme
MSMKGVFHTGITVKNLDVSIPWYRDVLGLELLVEPTDWTGESPELSQALDAPGADLRLAIFKVGDGSMELLEYRNPPSPHPTAVPANQLGAMHVAIRVDDAATKMEELKARGVEFLSPLNVTEEGPLNGWKWVYFRDPDGILLEIVECGPPFCEE